MKKILFLLCINYFCLNLHGQENDFYQRLSDAALSLTKDRVRYDPSYFKMDYPNGDVPPGKGVCTDVVVRAYRKVGIDLQKQIHEDMKANFAKYPSKRIWGLSTTDRNIDHRRVLNQQAFFTRKGKSLPVSDKAGDYKTGDLVTWDLGGGVPHIGIVVARSSRDGKRPLIVHNVGAGQVLQDCLFAWKITGHYRYNH